MIVDDQETVGEGSAVFLEAFDDLELVGEAANGREAICLYIADQGYPIGSETVESGCKNVVHHRMRRPGRDWKRDNAQAMLAGLNKLRSGRFT
jgi:hypothetical protein